jgi:hypothetical protein
MVLWQDNMLQYNRSCPEEYILKLCKLCRFVQSVDHWWSHRQLLLLVWLKQKGVFLEQKQLVQPHWMMQRQTHAWQSPAALSINFLAVVHLSNVCTGHLKEHPLLHWRMWWQVTIFSQWSAKTPSKCVIQVECSNLRHATDNVASSGLIWYLMQYVHRVSQSTKENYFSKEEANDHEHLPWLSMRPNAVLQIASVKTVL